MIALGVIFVVSAYLSAIVSKIFNFRQETMNGLCIWVFLIVLASVFVFLSSQHATFH